MARAGVDAPRFHAGDALERHRRSSGSFTSYNRSPTPGYDRLLALAVSAAVPTWWHPASAGTVVLWSSVYRFWKVWAAKLGYAFESFRKNDRRTDRRNPFVPGASSIWPGNDARSYSAHIVGVTVGYRLP